MTLLLRMLAPLRKSRRCRIVWAHLRAQVYLLRCMFTLVHPCQCLFVGWDGAGRQCLVAATSGSLANPNDPLKFHKIFFEE